jgi:hypothetical protein
MFRSNSAWCQGYCNLANLSKEDELKMLDLEEKSLEQQLEMVRKAKESTSKQEASATAEK